MVATTNFRWNPQSWATLVTSRETDIIRDVNLAFATKSIRSLCECEAKAERYFGMNVARKLKQRLADLRAASNFNDLLAGFPRDVDGDRTKKIVNLAEGARMIIRANHAENLDRKISSVDWANVTRIQILEIETNHA